MYQKLFQISLVLFLLVVTVAVLGLVISVLMSMLSPQFMAHTDSIVVVPRVLSNRQLGYIIVAASLIVAGFFLLIRRRRFRR